MVELVDTLVLGASASRREGSSPFRGTTYFMKHTVIYIPGLGDDHFRGQQFLISTWKLWGVQPCMVRMNWSQGDSFAPKLDRLLAKIDELTATGHKVSLVAASAGAGAAINAFAARKDVVSGVVLIAGWVNFPENIGPGYRRKNPAFVESAYEVQASLDKLDFDDDRSRIQSRFAFFDPIVPRKYSEVAGARKVTAPSAGHAFTIATQLIFGAPFWLRFLKMLES